jgi:tetratricopeptide (TPR) repeat protein
LTYLPKELGYLQNLKYLNLEGGDRTLLHDGVVFSEPTKGRLRELPGEMKNLKKLESLYLYGTENQFPEWVTNFTHIQEFSITISEINEVPDFLFNTTFPGKWFNSAEWFNDLGQHLLEKENLEQAMKSFKKSLSIDSSDRKIPRSISWLNKRLAYFDDRDLQAGPQKILNGVGSIQGIADIYFRLGIYDSALTWYKKLCLKEEENFNCMSRELRNCYFKLHQFHEAYLTSLSMITGEGLYSWNFLEHSQYCLADKQPAEAIESAKKGIQLLFEEKKSYQDSLSYYDYDAYLYLSLAYLLAGDSDSALRTYKIWHHNAGAITTWVEFKERYKPIFLFLEEAGHNRSEFKIIHDFNYEWWGVTIDD